MAIEVQMPRLSDTMEEGKILKWLKKVGDKIEVGDIIAEVETDKADMEMEALDAGVLAEIRVQDGESVAVGAVIAVLGEAGSGVVTPEPRKAESPKPPVVALPVAAPAASSERIPVEVAAPAAPPPPKVRELRESRSRREEREPASSEERVSASPVVRRMAEEHHIDLRQVHGSGPGGRIVKQDVEVWLAQSSPPAGRVRTSATPLPVSAPASALVARKETFSRMRATIAKRLTESMRDIPHFYVTCEIDMSEAVRLRSALKASDRVAAAETHARQRDEAADRVRHRIDEALGGVVGIDRGQVRDGDADGAAASDDDLEVAGNLGRHVAHLGTELAAGGHRHPAVLDVAVDVAGAADGDQVLDRDIALEDAVHLDVTGVHGAVDATAGMNAQAIGGDAADDIAVDIDLTAVADLALDDQILADEQIGGTLLWPLTDDLGTVRDLVNSSATVQNHLKYDSYGKVTSESNAAVDHLFAFTGRERDEETGLQYHRARYLDIGTGNWIIRHPASSETLSNVWKL